MIKQEFVPYEEAFALKELGFNEPCLGYYLCRNSAFGIDDLEITTECVDLIHCDYASCKVPTFSQAFRWFRDNHGLVSWISFRIDLPKKYLWYITDVKNIATRDGDYIFDILIESYEEAELACLRRLIELANEQQ